LSSVIRRNLNSLRKPGVLTVRPGYEMRNHQLTGADWDSRDPFDASISEAKPRRFRVDASISEAKPRRFRVRS
jgi:hypothetical protein